MGAARFSRRLLVLLGPRCRGIACRQHGNTRSAPQHPASTAAPATPTYPPYPEEPPVRAGYIQRETASAQPDEPEHENAPDGCGSAFVLREQTARVRGYERRPNLT